MTPFIISLPYDYPYPSGGSWQIAKLWLLVYQQIINFCQNSYTIESRKYAPLFCMLASGKTGEEAYARDRDIAV